jgi:hypothetical protein
MGTAPPAGSNALLVGHIHVFGPAIFGRMLAQTEFPEGAFGMVAPEATVPRFVRVITPDAVIAAAA